MFINLRRLPCRPTSPQTSSIAGVLALVTLLVPWVMPEPARADRTNDDATCRLVDADARPELLIVREEANFEADAIDTVFPSERVTLASDWRSILDPYGYYWIEIVEPVNGFLANRPANDDSYSTLRNCPLSAYAPVIDPNRIPYPGQTYTAAPLGTPNSNPMYSYCQEVVEPEGLVIRARPSDEAERVGGLAEGRTLLVASDMLPVLDTTGRYWLAIDYPVAGYISGGYSANFENIEPCRGDLSWSDLRDLNVRPNR